MPMKQRIFELDALRGISLFGIILMNILVFSLPYEMASMSQTVKGFNAVLLHLITLFVIGSFYPIFTFLFGYGLGMMFEHSRIRKVRFYPMIYRRLSFLLVIGVIHGMFIFSGDILFGYAFTGLFAVLFIKMKAQKLIKIASILFVFKILIFVVPFTILNYTQGVYEKNNYLGISLQQFIDVKQNGHYDSFLKLNVLENLYSMLDILMGSAFLEFLPYALFGIAAYKMNLIELIRTKSSSFLKWGSLIAILGYCIKMPFAIDYDNGSFAVINAVGGPIVSAGYIILIVYLCQSVHGAQIMRIFKYPGKLSLSVYITQSIMFTFIFMGFGLGLYNKLPLYQSYLIVIIFYSLQVIGCYFYLKKFSKGPIEWLWRKVTYLK